MKNKLSIICFLIACVAVVGFAIKAGQHHENCNECRHGWKETSYAKR